MMGWFRSSLKSLRRPSRQSRRAPKRNRSLIVEDLEGRRLLSQAIQSIVTLPRATSNMIAGPDGDLWVGVSPTDSTAAIDRIGLNGSVTSFPMPGNAAFELSIVSLTTGPDGNVWFDANTYPTNPLGNNQVVIGNVTPAGLVTEFPPIPVQPGPAGFATGIVSGPDGDLWFGYNINEILIYGQDFIGRATTAGAVTLIPVSSLSVDAPLDVSSLAAGGGGNLWFTQAAAKKHFGRISQSGVVTKFAVGNLFGGNVANGPNGSVIVTGHNSNGQNKVFRVSATGAVTRYKFPAAISSAFETYLGPADGSLWFTDGISTPWKIGQITARGVATSHNLSHFVRARRNGVGSMAVGQDGNLYLLDNIGLFSGITVYRPTATVYRFSPSELPRVR